MDSPINQEGKKKKKEEASKSNAPQSIQLDFAGLQKRTIAELEEKAEEYLKI